MSPAADAVIQRIDAARQQWWLFTLLSTTVLALCVSLGTLVLLLVADAYLKFSQPMLWIAFLSWLGMSLGLLFLVGKRLLRSQRSLEATARRIESEYPELHSSLINLVQLAETDGDEGSAFRDAAVAQAAVQIGDRRLQKAASAQSRRRRFYHSMQTPRDLFESSFFLALVIATTVLCSALIPNYGSAAGRMLSPWKFVPSVGKVKIVEVTPGDTEVLIGNSLTIAARIDEPPDESSVKDTTYKGTLFVTPDGEDETGLPMTADESGRRFEFTVPAVTKRFDYRLEIGDSQTQYYSVEAHEKPVITNVAVTIRYPSYLDRRPETFRQKNADVEAFQYSVAELRIRPSVPIAKGYVRLGNQEISGRVEEDGRLLVVKLNMLDNSQFTVHLANAARHTDPNPRVNRLRVIPDRAPTVQLIRPAARSSASADGNVPLTIRVGDDHGVGRVQVEMKIADNRSGDTTSARETPIRIVADWTESGTNTAVIRQDVLELDPQTVRPGQTVLIRAVAWDWRSVSDWGLKLEPQRTAGDWHRIDIVDADAQSAAELQQLDRLRAELWKILQKQLAGRVRTALIAASTAESQQDRAVFDIRTSQIDIQQGSVALAALIGTSAAEKKLLIKRDLGRLAVGEMLTAVGQCDELVKSRASAASNRPAGELLVTQDRIIDVLRKLLYLARRAQTEVLAEMKNRPGGDLPDDVKDTLDDLSARLEDALAQQKKVVEAAEDLAKAPVEDFTEEEEQLLEALAASEDDWSKFLNELNSDLSKLPEQDFANPSLLEELVEIQTEIKMAEDSMLKKAVDIAVPLEQLGAEMAEELKTNLEKWLPDSPDRERWSQEESLTDEDKEAPMAELPGELEDLIGELMEEEEALFDEMEDITSSAADSIDAGAGWDAMDGPISNMSAKGVTGNRLPNTSEIGGRSGEGRSGKSSGEFVGQEAVGKGGRKTPTRLTPDSVVQGQIKDHSKDPTGGATGGGKESGQGGEGLEGPQARSPGPRQLQRLAGKQAALRNKAEGVDVKFQIMNFHHTDLQKMIERMAQVERDLRAGRYQNALRQRKVLLEGLGHVKQYAEGEFEVRQDTTSNLPAEIQKEILGSSPDPSPTGWEDLNRKYFQRLSGAGADGETAN